MSQIETGGRSVKARELAAIADALGVSPLALLEPDSLVGRVTVAARTTETVRLVRSALLGRLTGLAEVASLLSSVKLDWENKPDVNLDDWLTSARSLSAWALDRVTPPANEVAVDQFLSWALAIQGQLGVDVLLEDFEDAVIGGAIVGNELPLIAINSSQGRQRALFTLAHELGHVLAADGTEISCDVDFRAQSPSERFANAFAAEFLLPAARVRSLTRGVTDSRVAVARVMLLAGLSKQTSVYRLHNLGLINATQRDALLGLRMSDFADLLESEDEGALLLTRGDELAPRSVTPFNLLSRLIDAYHAGEVSAAPIAGILGVSVEQVVDQYRRAEEALPQTAALQVQQMVANPAEEAFDGVPA